MTSTCQMNDVISESRDAAAAFSLASPAERRHHSPISALPPPHAFFHGDTHAQCCHDNDNVAMTTISRRQPSVSFALSTRCPQHMSLSHTLQRNSRNKTTAGVDLESLKPLTFAACSPAAPDVVEGTSKQLPAKLARGDGLSTAAAAAGAGCCSCRAPQLLAVVLALIVLVSVAIATVAFMNHFPTFSSPLSQYGCSSDADCGVGERCAPHDAWLVNAQLDGNSAAGTDESRASGNSAGARVKRCRCDQQCPLGYEPVCGSDGNTYHNECQLRVRACHTRVEIGIKSRGKCDIPDPCFGVVCPFGGRCIRQSTDNNNKNNNNNNNTHPAAVSGVCRCPDNCPAEQSGVVCGSDNVTYASTCHMQRAACLRRHNISVTFRNACDACAGHKCGEAERCVVSRPSGHVSCVCHVTGWCATVRPDPVCASDNVTYASLCAMRVQACRQGRHLLAVFRGQCETSEAKEACSRHECHYGSVCRWSRRERRPYCVCPQCHGQYSPVCGSDGRSYNNECKLRLEACETHTHVRVQYRGLCAGCEKRHCPNYGICESSGNGSAQCVCARTCVPLDEPVCGIDGASYANECELKVAACYRQQFITVAYRGKCDMCAHVACENGAVCEAGRCVCPLQCPETQPTRPSSTAVGDRLSPTAVCGTDGHTYSSRCQLEMAACQRRRTNWQSDRQGALQSIESVADGDRQASLSVLHTGPCKEQILNDESANALKTALCRQIRCKHGAICAVNGATRAHCRCPRICTDDRQVATPVCGSDLQLHRSACSMRRHSCLAQKPISARPLVLCKRPTLQTDDNEITCLGMEPMWSSNSSHARVALACSRNFTCPGNTFCHKTPNSSVCCRWKLSKSKNTKRQQLGSRTSPDVNAETPPTGLCSGSPIGCCPDDVTAPPGGNFSNCPGGCKCHRLGALGSDCSSVDGQCRCRPGVSGLRCNRCTPGYWGLNKIELGQHGCKRCKCHTWGSARGDCEQSRGRCVCRPHVHGAKCDQCHVPGHELTPQGICQPPRNDNGTHNSSVTPITTITPGRQQQQDQQQQDQQQQPRSFALTDAQQTDYQHDTATTNTANTAMSKHSHTVTLAHNDDQLTSDTARSFADGSYLTVSDESVVTDGSYRHLYWLLEFSVRNLSSPVVLMYREYDVTNRNTGRRRRSVPLRSSRHSRNSRSYSWSDVTGVTDSIQHSVQAARQIHAREQKAYDMLAIVDGYVVFCYNTGQGRNTLVSADPITIDRYHRVVVQRYHRDGQMTMDQSDPVFLAGRTRSTESTNFNKRDMSGADANGRGQLGHSSGAWGYKPASSAQVHIGGLPPQIASTRNGADELLASGSLIGCVRKLAVSRTQVVDLTGSHSVLRSHGVGACQHHRKLLLLKCTNRTYC